MPGNTIFVGETKEERKAAHDKYKKELQKLDIVQFVQHWARNALSRSEDDVYRNARRSLGYAYYGKWLLSEYRRMTLANLEFIGKHAKLNIHESQIDEAPNEYMRIMSLAVNRLRTPAGDDTIVLTLTEGDISINYAYIYTAGRRASPQRACIGWNYLSADGEYRPFLVDLQSMTDIRSAAISVWNTLEDIMNRLDASRNKLYYKASNESEQQLLSVIDRQSENKYLAAVWFACAFAHYNSIVIPNDYNTLIWRDGADLARMIEEFGEDAIKYISTNVVQYGCHKPRVWKKIPAVQTVIVGQKLMPLAKADLGNSVLNPQCPPWRELYVSQLASDMVISGQCHAFPMFIGWFPVFGVNIQLFKNADMRDAITLSDQIQAQGHDIKITRIVKSNIALNICTEYVGQPPGPDIMSDPAIFKRYAYVLAWANMSLNDKGVIHGDQHCRNVTLRNNPHFKLSKSGEPKKVIYIAPPHTWVFDDAPYTPSVIDFSRCMLLQYMTTEDVERMIALFGLMVRDEAAQAAFEALAHKRLRAAFAAFTAFDLLVHMDRVSRMCENPHPECTAFASEIHSAALKWISAPHKHGESFNAHVVHTMFKENRSPKALKKTDTIASIMFFKPKMQYSLQHFETLPPTLTTFRMQKEFGANEESVPAMIAEPLLLTNKIQREYAERKNKEEGYVSHLIALGTPHN